MSPRIALLVWSGAIGGAEALYAMLAAEMRRLGSDARVVFIRSGAPLCDRLDELGVPWTALEHPRSRGVLRHPRRFAQVVSGNGADAAILSSAGFLATGLRIGRYPGRIIGVEHGSVLQEPRSTWAGVKERLDRRSSVWALDVEVAVSDFLLRILLASPHAKNVVRIANGVDVDLFSPPTTSARRRPLVLGCGSRLITGKGVEYLLRSLTLVPDVELAIAGDGPERSDLVSLAASLGLRERASFKGELADMPDFWRSVDVAVVPSHEWVESFGMVAVEAMACARPVIATTNGALPEIVVDGSTGYLVRSGDPAALASAIERYARNGALLEQHRRAAREEAVSRYSITRCARDYLALVRPEESER